jgi:hypothetical protein
MRNDRPQDAFSMQAHVNAGDAASTLMQVDKPNYGTAFG